MNQPILERDPSDPQQKEINPLLKLALELGPLMVFFFANARGEWLAEQVPGAGRARRADLRRHRPVHGRDGDRARRLLAAHAHAADHAAGVGRRRLRLRRADALAAGRRLHQDEADHRQHAVRRGAARRPVLRQVAARLCLRFRLPARCRRLAQADACAGGCSSCSWPWSTRSSGARFSTDAWVAFKVWGIMPITLLFTFSQMPLIMRHSLEEKTRREAGSRTDGLPHHAATSCATHLQDARPTTARSARS